MKLEIKEITVCGLFAALTAIGAFLQIQIPLPLYTMHFTLQWFFVLMAGLLLGSKLGSISVLVYLLIGLMGIPVFAAGGGPAYVLRPGFGFLLGFLAAAFVIGKLIETFRWNKFWQYLLAAVIGEVVYYAIGAVYFYLMKNLYAGEAVSWTVVVVQYCLITVFPDFLLCVMATLVTMKLRVPIKKYVPARSV